MVRTDAQSKRLHVVVVSKNTTYRDLVVSLRDRELMRVISGKKPSRSSEQQSHRRHAKTLAQVVETLERLGASYDVVTVPHEPFSIAGVHLVVTVGGDGTLLAASHRCDSVTPIVGVNSDPLRSVGFFCGLRAGKSLPAGLGKALEGKLEAIALSRMHVTVNEEVVSQRVLNEALFCHASPAATSRYLVQLGRDVIPHKSSGFWIGPAAGSTAAQYSAGGKILPLASKRLQFVVREPYVMTGEVAHCKALIAEGQELVVYNLMREAKLFLDGPHNVIDVGAGAKLTFCLSREPLRVLALQGRRGRCRPGHQWLGTLRSP